MGEEKKCTSPYPPTLRGGSSPYTLPLALETFSLAGGKRGKERPRRDLSAAVRGRGGGIGSQLFSLW